MSKDRNVIRDLFEKDPKRSFELIISVEQHESEIIRTEIEEYVVTEDINKDFADVISPFLESRTSVPEGVCGWISGFFGSGKSHFLKILGYVLSNKSIEISNGRTVGASQWFCGRHNISGGGILDKILKTKAVFVHMLKFDTSKKTSVSHIVYEALLEEIGLSNVPWLAEVERTIIKDGLWEKFLKVVKAQWGKEWGELRTIQLKARLILVKALMEIDPETYTSVEMTNNSIDDIKNGFHFNQGVLAERLLEVAEEQDIDNGRVVVLLDEVGQYIGTDNDRLNDLNTVAEQIKKIGQGKIWLFVTSQENLEEFLPKVTGRTSQFQKIKDRFQLKIQLTPENIDTVVKKRLLIKKISDKSVDILRDLYSQHSGNLSTAALIKDTLRDHHNLFTQLDKQQFFNSYPFMPYHIRLMQHIFDNLRSMRRSSQPVPRRERAVLQVVKSILVNLADDSIGKLSTFDMVYDAINEELKAITSSEHAVIENEIHDLGLIGNMSISSVAKAIFLLQNIGHSQPCTAENISATLYPKLGTDREDHLRDVKKCLDTLVDKRWILEEDNKYRFLSEIERTFESEVERQTVNEVERAELSFETAKRCFSDIRTFNYKNMRTFDVHLTADDREINNKGHIKVIFYSPRMTSNFKELLEIVRNKSLANKDTIYWISGTNEQFEDAINRTIMVQKALREMEHQEQTVEEQNILYKHKSNLDLLEKDELPQILSKAATSGTVVYRGEDRVYGGNRRLQDIFNERIDEVIKEIFTQFLHAEYKVENESDIVRILDWHGGKLPKIYKELSLIDDGNNIQVDRPVPRKILDQVKIRAKEGIENQTGQSIIDYFDKPPFGWDPKIVRLTLAALFKFGSILVNFDGREYSSATDTRSHEPFLSPRAFNRAVFILGQEVDREQKKETSSLISEIFGEKGGNTLEEIDKALETAIINIKSDCTKYYTVSIERNLPIKGVLEQLSTCIEDVLEAPNSSKRVFSFLEPSRKEIFKIFVPLLEKLKKADNNGSLQKYYLIKEFINSINEKFFSGTNDENIVRIINNIKQGISTENFIDHLSNIIEQFQTVIFHYSNIYIEKHNERTRLANEAIDQLSIHPIFTSSNSSAHQQAKNKISSLEEFICSVDSPVIDEANFKCKKCDASLNDLFNNIEMIDSRKHRLSNELDNLWMPEEPGKKNVELKEFQFVLTSTEDMSKFNSKIYDYLTTAIKLNKSVKINVKLE